MSDSALRRCSRCGEQKRKPGCQSYCRECMTAYTRDRRARRAGLCAWCHDPVADGSASWCEAHRERARASSRRASWARQGIDMDDERYEALLASQRGACAICRETPNERLAVDHCHRTSAVRGLVCMSCNVLLGHANDNAALLRRAADYVERNERPEAA